MSTPTGLLPDITITRAAAPYGAERIDVLKQSIAHLQTVDSLKRHTARKLIEHADGIIAVLDTIKDIHPVITLAIIPFKAAMEVFASKNDNDKRVGALLIQMMDMMTPLLDLSQLNKTHKTEKMPTAENPEGLENVLKTADEHMTAANNMVDKYRKVHSWDRVMRVQRWSDKFTDLAGQFQQDKQAMLWALHSHTAHTVDAIDRKLDGVFEFMKEMFKNPTGEEKLLTEFLKKEQNKIALPGNGDEFERLYTAYYRDGVRERPRKTGIGRPGDTAGNLQEVKREAREEWGTLQTSIEDLLVENRSTFERNLKIVKDRLESEIKQVEHNIMKKLNDGHHVHIHDKEIRHLWKIMNWRVSVKTRHFTVTLHDHYLHDLTVSRARSLDGETPVTPSQASAPVIIDAADRWCLPYLGIRYLPSISEAFDDDGSGFIKVSEVNAFTDGMPQEWSLLRWIAYWNGAWPSEIFRYAQRIRQILAQMSTAQMRVRRENVEPVQNYLNVLAFAEIQSIIDAISHVVQPREAEPELQWLAKSYRAQTEKAIRDTLEKAQYHIDAPGSIVLLFGAGRIEKYLLPLLELLLSRHLDIIVFAKEYILDSRELQGAGVSLSSAFRKVWERVTVLQESFRQQKLDVNEQFKGFSCGIYSQYHYGKFVNRIGCEVQMKWYDTDLDDTYSDDGSTVDDDDELSSKITLMQPEATGPLSSIEPGPPIMAGKNLLMSDHDERTLINPGSPVQGSVHQETQLDTAPTVFHPIDQHAPEPSTSLDQLSDPVKDTKNPTFYGPFSRHLYKENVELQTDEAFPWTPLNIRFGTVPPLQMFRLAADRVLESVQLISPRLTRNYLQRRRSIRLQWLNIALRSPTIYSGDHEYKEREPSNDKERRNLTLSHHISKADIAFYEALADVQSRLHSRHDGFFCDGCYSEIYGKRFHCIDCEDFDLCNDCEHADPPRHPSTDHSTSHTMILFKFNTSNRLARGMFDHRAKKHMAKHERSGCGCSRLEGTSAFIENEIVECACCKEAILNKGHFRCLQCSEVDICEDCERSGSPEHCPSHAMIKVMIPPGNEGVLSDVEDTDDEGPPLNVEEKLDRMRKYIRDMKISHKNRLDQMQADFTSKLDQVITLLEQKQPPNPASFNEHRYCILRSPDA